MNKRTNDENSYMEEIAKDLYEFSLKKRSFKRCLYQSKKKNQLFGRNMNQNVSASRMLF